MLKEQAKMKFNADDVRIYLRTRKCPDRRKQEVYRFKKFCGNFVLRDEICTRRKKVSVNCMQCKAVPSFASNFCLLKLGRSLRWHFGGMNASHKLGNMSYFQVAIMKGLGVIES